MHRHIVKGTIVVLFMSAAFGLLGCGKPSDDSANKSIPVAKKIASQETQEKKDGAEEKPKSTQPAVAPQGAPSADAAPSKPETQPATKIDEKAPAQPQAETPKEETAAAENKPVSELYNPAGKIDPFMPLFKEEQAVTEEVSSPVKKQRRSHLTPLEKVDLSQLSLMGTILAKSGNRAMIADSGGKGYVVTVGTYMGMSSGRVVEILKDRIVVEEEVENILGKTSLQKRELKILKPLGE